MVILGRRRYDSNHFDFATARVVSPLEVQYNDSLWMPAAISFNAGDSQGSPLHTDCASSGPGACTNWSKKAGAYSVVATVPTAIPIGCSQQCEPPEVLKQQGRWCVNCTHNLQVSTALASTHTAHYTLSL